MATAAPALSRSDLLQIAQARIEDAECLLAGKRYDGAIYLCGYAVELGLKARICMTLGWADFRPDGPGGKDYSGFKIHKLPLLLAMSGLERRITTKHTQDWLTLASWGPEMRYKTPGSATEANAKQMIRAAKRLLRIL